MPILACPRCQRTVTQPDGMGDTSLACPGCGALLTRAVAPAPPLAPTAPMTTAPAAAVISDGRDLEVVAEARAPVDVAAPDDIPMAKLIAAPPEGVRAGSPGPAPPPFRDAGSSSADPPRGPARPRPWSDPPRSAPGNPALYWSIIGVASFLIVAATAVTIVLILQSGPGSLPPLHRHERAPDAAMARPMPRFDKTTDPPWIRRTEPPPTFPAIKPTEPPPPKTTPPFTKTTEPAVLKKSTEPPVLKKTTEPPKTTPPPGKTSTTIPIPDPKSPTEAPRPPKSEPAKSTAAPTRPGPRLLVKSLAPLKGLDAAACSARSGNCS